MKQFPPNNFRPPSPTLSPSDLLDMVVSVVGTREVMVTKAVAEAILSLNTGNRNVTEGWVDELARRMQAGEWMNTGEPIILSRDGVLNDGQHRLLAVIQSGQSVKMDIRFGVDREAFRVTNTGKSRTPANVLSVLGYKHTTRLAATAVILIRYRRMLARSAESGEAPTILGEMRGGYNASHLQVVNFIKEAPALAEMVRKGPTNVERKISNAHIDAATFLSRLHDEEAASEFWPVFGSGVTSDVSHPARLLRERLLRDLMTKLRMPPDDKLALALKAWLMFKQGRRVTELRFRGGNHSPEPFPRLPVLHLLPDMDAG